MIPLDLMALLVLLCFPAVFAVGLLAGHAIAARSEGDFR